jgi:hypothetical protein
MKTRCVAAGLAAALLLACNEGANPEDGSSGGAPHAGGSASAGTTSAGGKNAGGGTAGNGGTTGAGGTSSKGGNPGSGGNNRRGGTTGSGGATGKGGATARGSGGGSGGTTARGGSGGSGGYTARGGDPGNGGTTGRGGSTGSGGATGVDGGTGADPACTREMLQGAVDSYLAAMEAGDASHLPLGPTATYTENGTPYTFGQGLWASALPPPDLHMSLLDVDKCGSYTEAIIAGGSHPYVLGIRLAVEDGQISEVTVLATDCDDWGFNASSYLRYAKAEQTNTAPGSGWGPVAPDDQLSRAELQAAGDAYFAYWADKTVSVPWGYPCSRLEGGMATNPDPNPNRSSTCSVGIPNQSFAPKANDYLVDVDHGMVVLFLNLPGPDSHWFRITKSTLMRYIHTLTICYVNGTWQCPGDAPTCS